MRRYALHSITEWSSSSKLIDPAHLLFFLAEILVNRFVNGDDILAIEHVSY